MAGDEKTIPRSEVERPPQPPKVGQKPKLHVYQWIGIPIFALVTVLALFGLFGESRGEAAEEGGVVSLRAEYPTRFRYKQVNPIRVWVTNTSAAALDTVTVVFDTAYINRFSNVTFTPSPKRPYEVELTDVRPGETRFVLAGLQGEHYWRHSGRIAAAAGGDTTAIRVSTLVFP